MGWLMRSEEEQRQHEQNKKKSRLSGLGSAIKNEITGELRHRVQIREIQQEASREAELKYAAKGAEKRAKQKYMSNRHERTPSGMAQMGSRMMNIFGSGAEYNKGAESILGGSSQKTNMGGLEDFGKKAEILLGSGEEGKRGMGGFEGFNKKSEAILTGKPYQEHKTIHKIHKNKKTGKNITIHIGG